MTERTIDWVDGEIHLIDQTRLPDELVFLRVASPDALVDAISRLAVRGAPALGVAGAMGVALLARSTGVTRRGQGRRRTASRRTPDGREPRLGDGSCAGHPAQGPDAVLAEALAVRDEDIAACSAMATRGADLVRQLVTRPGSGP